MPWVNFDDLGNNALDNIDFTNLRMKPRTYEINLNIFFSVTKFIPKRSIGHSAP